MKQHDFTNGSVMRQLYQFSTPILLANLLQVSYQFIDSLWIGNLLGAQQLGAVTVASTIIFTVLSLIIGFNNAALTILSQYKGSGQQKGLASYLNAFVVVLSSLSVILGVVGITFSNDILRFLGTPKEMMEDANIYLQINFLGILFLFGYNFISTVLRSVGDSKTPLKFVFLAVLLNTCLDPILIKSVDLGMSGAAYATVISQGVAFLYGLFYILKKRLVPFSIPHIPKQQEVWTILKLGIPAGLQMMVISGGVMAIMSVVNQFGKDVVAGFGAAQRLDSIIMLPAHALGTAVNSMAGQNIGAKKWDRVEKIALYGAIYNFIVMTLFAILAFVFARASISLFIDHKTSIQVGTSYLQWISFFYPLLGLNFVLNGVVRASGAMFQVLILNIISFWVLRYPLTFVFANWLGEKGIAIGMGISFTISSIFAFMYYRFGGWRKKTMVEKRKVRASN